MVRIHGRIPEEQSPFTADGKDDDEAVLRDGKPRKYPPAPLSTVLELDVKTPEVLLSIDQQDFETDERLPTTPLPPGVPSREDFWQKLPNSLKMRLDANFEKLYKQMTDDERLAFEQQVAWDYEDLARQYMPTVLELYGVRPPAYRGKPVNAAKQAVYKKLLRRAALLDRGDEPGRGKD